MSKTLPTLQRSAPLPITPRLSREIQMRENQMDHKNDQEAPFARRVSELYEQAYRRAQRAAMDARAQKGDAERSPALCATSQSPDLLPPVHPRHPGRALREDFLRPRKLTPERLCAATGIAPERLEELLCEREPICETAATALAAFFGGHSEFWLELQERYEEKV